MHIRTLEDLRLWYPTLTPEEKTVNLAIQNSLFSWQMHCRNKGVELDEVLKRTAAFTKNPAPEAIFRVIRLLVHEKMDKEGSSGRLGTPK